MHPNVFLKTFWQMEFKSQIFVAMSFSDVYKVRFENVIAPAIKGILLNGIPLSPYRVDISKSGDSILTDIMDGIAHSQMVLCDVSSIGKDSKTGEPYRNGNVMYEIGLALACRQPSEVLLIRDDRDKFLFDVSTIPHMHINYSDMDSAKKMLQTELLARLKEQTYINDARVQLAIESLSGQEIKMLSELIDLQPDQSRSWEIGGTVLSVYEAAIMRLLDKRLIKLTGKFEKGFPGYQLTYLGRVVATAAKSGLPTLQTLKRLTGDSTAQNQELSNEGLQPTPTSDAAEPGH